jgi:S-adenosylmethionine decarboxylase
MIVGTEWLVDASGCRAETLRDVAVLRRLFERIISDLNLQVVGEQMWHAFPQPGGVTGLALLTESHLACHTYPEFQTATINLYCCRERPAWPWAERLAELLGASSVSVRVHQRLVDDSQAKEHELFSKTAESSVPALSGGEL